MAENRCPHGFLRSLVPCVKCEGRPPVVRQKRSAAFIEKERNARRERYRLQRAAQQASTGGDGG